MKNKYNVTDIIEAINLLLEPNINTKKFTDKLEKPKIEPLKLVNEIKPSEDKIETIPRDTENIIVQAEKYLKK
tara:strand:+ start:2063 stop:2281 length:219 start_codon:yes stop_codon:yes gene_type:complete